MLKKTIKYDIIINANKRDVTTIINIVYYIYKNFVNTYISKQIYTYI